MLSPVLTLPEYAELVASLPAPTAAQMETFAEFVSHAHSWYKHLPILRPTPFQFFLDPSAGMERRMRPDGAVQVAWREKCGFHCSWLRTAEYRAHFGHLAFSRSAGTSVSVVVDGGRMIGSDDAPEVYCPRRQRLLRLPGEVLEAGRASVTRVIHAGSADPNRWVRFLEVHDSFDWPEESGGRQTAEKIVERVRTLRSDPSKEVRSGRIFMFSKEHPILLWVDLPMHQLLEPERQRQRRGMVAAMSRLVELVGKSVT